jgi:8-oxo-dGTP pyrophosphatase MutT (NUDIX family)
MKMNKSAGCIVIRNGYVLLIKKNEQWQFPKGKPSPNDPHLVATAIRETFEETNIASVPINKSFTIRSHKNILVVFYVSVFLHGKPLPNVLENITEARWIKLSRLTNILIAWQKPLVKKIFNYLLTKNIADFQR